MGPKELPAYCVMFFLQESRPLCSCQNTNLGLLIPEDNFILGLHCSSLIMGLGQATLINLKNSRGRILVPAFIDG